MVVTSTVRSFTNVIKSPGTERPSSATICRSCAIKLRQNQGDSNNKDEASSLVMRPRKRIKYAAKENCLQCGNYMALNFKDKISSNNTRTLKPMKNNPVLHITKGADIHMHKSNKLTARLSNPIRRRQKHDEADDDEYEPSVSAESASSLASDFSSDDSYSPKPRQNRIKRGRKRNRTRTRTCEVTSDSESSLVSNFTPSYDELNFGSSNSTSNSSSTLRSPAQSTLSSSSGIRQRGTKSKENKRKETKKRACRAASRRRFLFKTYGDPSFAVPMRIYFPPEVVPKPISDTFCYPPLEDSCAGSTDILPSNNARNQKVEVPWAGLENKSQLLSRELTSLKIVTVEKNDLERKVNYLGQAAKDSEVWDYSLEYDADDEDIRFVSKKNGTMVLNVNQFERIMETLEISFWYYFIRDERNHKEETETSLDENVVFDVMCKQLKETCTVTKFMDSKHFNASCMRNNLISGFQTYRKKTVVIESMEDMSSNEIQKHFLNVIEYWWNKRTSFGGSLLRKFQQSNLLTNWTTTTQYDAAQG